ncbi:ABC transporter substrate-binding protein [Desmonostoc muscorum LEGE 12446]|uniref:ABC transporter substrate-binding protein n=1 Tax=Desmonostoc muscorum LEGE 12446 TaxID=1828758 RepID=A0A8J6ZZT0_DESMC|nr:ABC transporter substrate-binding protein [Desmonostoc muscorum]MCF2149712.1 ABC transporter substrate-binding protein [Desmonostoc muscorum LEGE 12446]
MNPSSPSSTTIHRLTRRNFIQYGSICIASSLITACTVPRLAGSGTQLLMGDAVDFFMGYGIDAVNAVAQGIAKITVAAIFHKNPWCLIAHPNRAIKTLGDLKGKPIYVSASAIFTDITKHARVKVIVQYPRV